MRFDGQVVLLLQVAALVEEAVIGGDEDVVDVGVRQFLHQSDQILDGILAGAEGVWLGGLLVPGGVDLIVVDVEQPVVLDEVPSFTGLHAEERIGLDRCASHWREQSGAVLGSCAGSVVHLHRPVVGEGKGFVWQ